MPERFEDPLALGGVRGLLVDGEFVALEELVYLEEAVLEFVVEDDEGIDFVLLSQYTCVRVSGYGSERHEAAAVEAGEGLERPGA
ncbi:hypothetical protein [Rubrobacter xylanophilus]|uniref:hypothetical protein n=1 Tax=Rubrobacter xylanophilus TaxID=49319 RepID=UPI0018DCC118|nr:hypothetical protein [Rubrobacter xylanophilus]